MNDFEKQVLSELASIKAKLARIEDKIEPRNGQQQPPQDDLFLEDLRKQLPRGSEQQLPAYDYAIDKTVKPKSD